MSSYSLGQQFPSLNVGHFPAQPPRWFLYPRSASAQISVLPILKNLMPKEVSFQIKWVYACGFGLVLV